MAGTPGAETRFALLPGHDDERVQLAPRNDGDAPPSTLLPVPWCILTCESGSRCAGVLAMLPSSVMAGLDPAIQAETFRVCLLNGAAWMPGSSPGMTASVLGPSHG